MNTPLLGLRTVIYATPDLATAKTWYADVLGLEPYFDEPFYVGFSVGGYELGLDPNVQPAEGSTLTYWGVTDIRQSWQHWLDRGALPYSEPQNVGGSVWVATVTDPFGNVVGLIENPAFHLPD